MLIPFVNASLWKSKRKDLKDSGRKKLIREYYARRSRDYDVQKNRTWKSSQGFGDEIFDELLTTLTGFGNRLVLEVGVGTGRNALPLFRKVKPRLIGLDFSKEMLKQAKSKMSPFKENLDLILADGEHPPFMKCVFDALISMSTMHYFASQKRILLGFRRVLKENGTLVYGDLTVHEADNQGFFEGLERTLSKAHAHYYKLSQIKTLIEKRGFGLLRMKTTSYRKSYVALMEDKGQYFGVTPQTLHRYVRGADEKTKERYELTSGEMTMFYTLITAKRT
jgi:ubiquinone/menaquinone biosynthesis C-methylase UbiE